MLTAALLLHLKYHTCAMGKTTVILHKNDHTSTEKVFYLPHFNHSDKWRDEHYIFFFTVYIQLQQNVSGYTCNHGTLRIGNETLRPLGVAMGTPSA